MIWDWEFALQTIPRLLEHFLKFTLVATAVGSLLAAVIGLAFAMIRRARIPVLAQLTTVIVEFIRSTPLPIHLLFLFYGLPSFGPTLEPLTAGIIGLGIHYACYYAEVYRAGIDAVPTGQWEASTALHLSPAITWRQVVLPQAVRNVLPALGNYVVAMFKETPFLLLITVPELVFTANLIASNTANYVEPFTMAALIFLAASYPTALLVRKLERRLEAW